MSQRFRQFVERVGKYTYFIPMRNQIFIRMLKEAQSKYKKYPMFIEKMEKMWNSQEPELRAYRRKSNLSGFLVKYGEKFFYEYMRTIFPFVSKRLKIEEMKAPSKLDWIITVSYEFTEKELAIIEETLEKLREETPEEPTPSPITGNKPIIKKSRIPDLEKACKYLLLYAVNSFAEPIREMFGRPFSFMPSEVKAEKTENDTLIVRVCVQGREQ